MLFLLGSLACSISKVGVRWIRGWFISLCRCLVMERDLYKPSKCKPDVLRPFALVLGVKFRALSLLSKFSLTELMNSIPSLFYLEVVSQLPVNLDLTFPSSCLKPLSNWNDKPAQPGRAHACSF